jgi:hypothetical protein
MDIIKFSPETFDRKRHVENGKKICSENIFFKNMINLVQYPEFTYMSINYFNSYDNIKLFLIFIKVYESVTKKYPNISPYEKISILKILIDNSDTRRLICKEVIDNTKKILITT